MKYLKLLINVGLISGVLNSFAQKLTKEQRSDLNLASKSIKIDLVKGDTAKLLRAPVSLIKSSEKYYIDALQKRLDEVNKKVKSNFELEIDEELSEIKKFIGQIQISDSNWPSTMYNDELNIYYNFYKKAIQVDSLKKLKNEIQKDSLNNIQNNSKANSSYSKQPSSSKNQYHEVQTGPRGGQYYINKNGKKTYVKKKK